MFEVGHEVQVAAPSSFAGAVSVSGLRHVPFPDASAEAMGAVFGRIPQLTMRAADDLVIREVFGRLDAAAALPTVRKIVESWRPDVVVREPAELSSYVVAEQLGIPQVQVNIGLDRFLDKLSVLGEPLAELGSRNGVAGLVDLPRWTLAPPSFDLAASGASTAPERFRDRLAVGDAPRTLPEWWPGCDDPIVYVTFGSVTAQLGFFPAFYARALATLADTPVRVLLTLGEAGTPDALGPVPANAHVERWWPQVELMPHVSAVVGHGGFGTTLLALAAGVPQVVVPLFTSDQYDNAARVAAVHAGIALLDPDVDERRAGEMVPAGPTAIAALPDAVFEVIRDKDLHAGARRLASEMGELPDAADCSAALADLVASR